MKKIFIGVLMASLASLAWGTNNGHSNVHTTGASATSTSTSNNINRNTSNSVANQHQVAKGGTGGAGGKGGTGMGGTGGSATNGSVDGSQANNANMQVNTTTPRQTAQAANVTVMPTAVCSGVTGGGASSAAFGVSFGTSWTDANCMLLEQVRTTAVILGEQEVASEMMCAVEAYRDARARMGNPCKTKLQAVTAAPAASVEYTDPIIRARLGLPPLN
jgi:hypothetical protein